jgi:hypothetical protein
MGIDDREPGARVEAQIRVDRGDVRIVELTAARGREVCQERA